MRKLKHWNGKNENLLLTNSCDEHKKLLDVLKLNHETILASHEELLEQHASLIKVFTKKLKTSESSSHGSID